MSKKIFLLTFLFALTVSLLGAWFYGRETTGGSGQQAYLDAQTPTDAETEQTRYLKAEELYYYQNLYDLLDGNQAEEDLGRFDVIKEYNIEVMNDYDKPNAVIGAGHFALFLDESLGYPFAEISTEMNANPFSNFNLLVKKGWVKPVEDNYFDDSDYPETDGTVFCIDGFTRYASAVAGYNAPMLSVDQEYEYTERGCEKFLNVVSALEAANQNSYRYLANGGIPEVYYSEADDCFYCISIEYNRETAQIYALYFRSSDGKRITDVTTQLLLAEFPWGDPGAGGGTSINYRKSEKAFGALTLTQAVEQALSGTSYFSEPFRIGEEEDAKAEYLVLPAQYAVGEYTVTVNRKNYETDLEYPAGRWSFWGGDFFRLYTHSIKLK